MKLTFGAGLNENQFASHHEAFIGSQNFELRKDASHLMPRKAFDLKATAPNGGAIRGIMQMIARDGSDTTIIQAGNTTYSWNGSSFGVIASCDPQSQLRATYWPLDDLVIVTDLQKLHRVIYVTSAGLGGELATGLPETLYAKYCLVHNNRVWFFNVKTTGADTPHLILASAFEDHESYDTSKRVLDQSFTSGEEAFYMLTPDLKEINGAKLFHGDLILSTVGGSLFKLTGSDSTTYAFETFYAHSEAIGNEAMVETGNDVIYMKKGGAIESLRSTAEYGDTAADDLSRWIPDTVKNLTDAIAIYDQQNQKVLFFCEGKVLVLFKDLLLAGSTVGENGEKAKLSPWSVYVTSDPGDFNCQAALYMREPGTDLYNVFWGGSDGRIFTINGTGEGDAGSSDIRMVRTTRFISKNDAKINFPRHVTQGLIQYRRQAPLDFSITLDWGDEFNQSTATIPLKGAPADSPGVFYGGTAYYGADNYYNQGFAFANKITHQNCSWVGKGSGCSVIMTTLDTQQYQVDNIELL